MSTNPPRALLAQLYALRAQLDAVIVGVEDVASLEAQSGHCTHPPERRRDATTMGGPQKFKCLDCGKTVEGVA